MAPELYRGPLNEDLRPLSALLWGHNIGHRIAEEDGAQVLRLASARDRDRALALLGRWRAGDVTGDVTGNITGNITGDATIERRRASRAAFKAGAFGAFAGAPVTLLLIVAAVLGFAIIYADAPLSWVSLLTYEPFTLQNGRVVFGDGSGQPWRLVTPVFLHFGWLHIAFNSLWCWELGRRIEGALGSLNMAGLFLVTAVASNTAQHQVSGPTLFGGLSGVIYGLLGFTWIAARLNPRWLPLAPAAPVMLFMLGWLVVCLLGVVDRLGFSVANAAHLGGLLCGAFIGAVFALAYR